MSTRTVFLIKSRRTSQQRAHFSTWVPYQEAGLVGTRIHVVGAPMAGYQLEFNRAYEPYATDEPNEIIEIAKINAQLVHDWTGPPGLDSTPRGNLEQVAAEVPPPGISQNFLAPVNDTTNRRCQEWTMDFIRRLVALNYLHNSAIDAVQARRDPPNHGIFGLQGGIGRGAGQPGPAEQAVQQPRQAPVQQQQYASGIDWIWDDVHGKFRYWNGSEWVWQT